MKGALDQHAHALRQALQRLSVAPFAQLLTVLVMALSLGLPALLFRVVSDAGALARSETGPPKLTVFLPVDASDTLIRAVRAGLEARPDFARVHYIAPGDALAGLQKRTGLGDLLAGLDDHNPLPPAFEIEPRDPEPGRLQVVQTELKRLHGVELVQLDADWARRLYALSRFLEQGVLLLAAVMVSNVLMVVVNTLRLQILAAREELEVCQLLGAGHAFIRRPFLYFGILQMLLGSGLALGLAELARLGFNSLSLRVLAPYGLHFEVQPAAPAELLAVVAFAVFSGWLAAAWTVAAFLRGLRKG